MRGRGHAADHRRRHRALLQAADDRARGDPGHPGDDPRRRSRPRRARWRAGVACARSPSATRRRPANCSSATPAASCARSKCWRRPAGRSREWQRENMPPVLDPAKTVRVFLDRDREELQAPRRSPLRPHARRRCDRGSAGAGGAQPRSEFAGDEGARRAVAAAPFARRDRPRRRDPHAKIDTFQYTKRQFTWFRNQLPDWPWEKPEQALERGERRRLRSSELRSHAIASAPLPRGEAMAAEGPGGGAALCDRHKEGPPPPTPPPPFALANGRDGRVEAPCLRQNYARAVRNRGAGFGQHQCASEREADVSAKPAASTHHIGRMSYSKSRLACSTIAALAPVFVAYQPASNSRGEQRADDRQSDQRRASRHSA